MAETRYKLNPYVIQDISSCLREFGADGIMFESFNVYFPNMSDVDEIDFSVDSSILSFNITIDKTNFTIYVPKKSEVSMHDQWIDFQFPNGDFFVIRLKGKIQDIEWLNINNQDKVPNFAK